MVGLLPIFIVAGLFAFFDEFFLFGGEIWGVLDKIETKEVVDEVPVGKREVAGVDECEGGCGVQVI